MARPENPKTGKVERERARDKDKSASTPRRGSPDIHKLGGPMGIQQGGGQKAKKRS
ncbi:MAG: hypothetical protein AB1469_01055 [Pseudomonadota bacterium]